MSTCGGGATIAHRVRRNLASQFTTSHVLDKNVLREISQLYRILIVPTLKQIMLSSNMICIIGLRGLCRRTTVTTCLVTKRSYQFWPEVESKEHIFMPKDINERALPQVPHSPVPKSGYPEHVEHRWPIKYPKRNCEMRGPETIHNQLIYRQFGMIALGGGALRSNHFDMIKAIVDKYLDLERFFAVWRVDPPWKAVSQKSSSHKMGGGKARVHHYETPVRAGRIIIEIGGIGEFGELIKWLKPLSERMPCYAIPITQQMMDDLKKEKEDIAARNINPFSYRRCLELNFSNAKKHINPGEVKWKYY